MSVCMLEHACNYAGTNKDQMMYRPTSGVDLNDPDQLAFGSVGSQLISYPLGAPLTLGWMLTSPKLLC